VFSQLKASLKERSRAIIREKRGAVLIYTALAAPVFIGMVGLSVDVAGWQAQKRQLQTIADAAAIGGALERIRSGTAASVEPAALIDAETNGYVAASDQIVVNIPPQSGPRAGAGDSVEVIVRRETPTLFSHLFVPNTSYVSARAVAVGDINDTCIWALNKTAQSAVKVAGAAIVDLSCGIFNNSNDDAAMTQSGAGCLTATNIKSVGGYNVDCTSVEPVTGANPVTDPLEALQTPGPFPACTNANNITVNGGESLTLDPCVYTGKITVIADGIVDFNPGLYVFDGAGLSFCGPSTAPGDGVHFYMTENNGTADTFDITAGASVSLTAGTTDEWGMAGILIYHDRNSPTNVVHSLTGGAFMDLEGIIYFPVQDVKYSGGSAIDISSTMLIADEVDISGNTVLGDFDGSAVEANTLLIEASLVE
jgi:hypothetical protein